MAISQGEVTLNSIVFFDIDTDPSLGVGLAANVGDIAMTDSGVMYIKTGSLNTSWEKVVVGSTSGGTVQRSDIASGTPNRIIINGSDGKLAENNGLVNERLVIGDSTGLLTQNANLVWNTANNALLVGMSSPLNNKDTLQVNGSLGFTDLKSARISFEDFVSTSVSYMIFRTITSAANGGAATLNTTILDNNSNGVVTLATGTTSNATGYCTLQTSNGSNNMIISDNSTTNHNIIRFETRAMIPILSGTPSFKIRLGMMDGVGNTDPTNGVFFSYTNTENGGQWVATCRRTSTSTILNSNIAVVANQWYKLKFQYIDGIVSFYIDEEYIGAITTNIPTSGVRIVENIVKTSTTTTSRLLYLDWYAYQCER